MNNVKDTMIHPCISIWPTADGTKFSAVIPVNAIFNTIGDGYWSTAAKAVYVTAISMRVDNGCADDLAVTYNEATWDNEVDGLIYTDSLFIKELKDFLIAKGLDADIVNDISYSEQGMQDGGRVSFDAYKFADMLKANA